MSSKVVLIIILITHLSVCQDWCSIITTNGIYRGLGAYRRWYATKEDKSEFVMFNRWDYEWKFTIEGSRGANLSAMHIRIVDNSLKSGTNSTVSQRFSLYVITLKPIYLFDWVIDCWVRF